MGRITANHLRIAGWGAAALLLALPAVGMQLGAPGLDWSARDFVIVGGMLAFAGLALELATRRSADPAYRAGAALTALTGLLLIWLTLAVGVVGSEDDPANRMYAAVLAVPLLGGLLARFRAGGMVVALAATAVAQAVVTAVALGGVHAGSGPLEILMLNGGFAALWLGAAWLFGRAAARRPA